MGVELRGLEGKVVLVTGAGKGQGANHARAFAEAGCDVAALDIAENIDDIYDLATPDDLELTGKQIEQAGRRGLTLECDVRDEEAVRDAVAAVLEHFGRIDVVVNNAGVAALDSIQDMRSSALHAIIDTNLKGPMFVAKYVAPGMIERRSGTFVNIASAVTGSGHAMLSHYVASKHGILGLTSAWANELAPHDIRVNAICPATIRPGEGHGSGMVLGLSATMQMEPEEAFEVFSEQGSLLQGARGRAEMDDITDAVLFLASDNARIITGHTLYVDCGQAAK